MIVSNSKKFIFSHIPKAGGSTLSRILSIHAGSAPIVIAGDYLEKEHSTQFYNHDCMCTPITNDHRQPSWLHGHHVPMRDVKYIKLEDYFKFAFTRNPFDRLVSIWEIPFIKFKYPFSDFIKVDTTEEMKLAWSIRTQYDIVSDDNGLLLDYVGKYENIEDDFEYVRNKLDIPKKILLDRRNNNRRSVDYNKLPYVNKNINKDHDNYREYYNTKTRNLVEKYYRKDLETFEYEF